MNNVIYLFHHCQQIFKQTQQMQKNNILVRIIKKDQFIKSNKTNIKQNYDFINVLGKGSFGTVFLAKTKYPPQQLRAIKIINKDKLKNKNTQYLIDEVSILKMLDHPSIIKIYQTYENDKHLCIVLEQIQFITLSYCGGGQLYQRMIKYGSFNQNSARTIFSQMVVIVKYLHSNKICHRDLKLQNFLLNNQQNLDIKLIDFGLSKQWIHDLRTELRQNGQNKLVGTLYYIAPQVILKDYDERCDIWSLGVILYILVTGIPPFDGQSDKEIISNITTYKYTLDCKEMKDISTDLKDLICRILVPESQRISIDSIISHPWLVKVQSSQPLPIDFHKMAQFTHFSKIKKIALTYLASQLPQTSIHQLGQVFKQTDLDNNGLLTEDEMKHALQQQQDRNSISTSQLMKIMVTADTDKNGRINYNQFITACMEGSYYNDQRYLKRIFDYFDVNKDGVICYDQFKEILTSTDSQLNMQDQEIGQMIKYADLNKDGKIDYVQFVNCIKNDDNLIIKEKMNIEIRQNDQ